MQVRQCGGNDVYQMFVQSCAVAVPMYRVTKKVDQKRRIEPDVI